MEDAIDLCMCRLWLWPKACYNWIQEITD